MSVIAINSGGIASQLVDDLPLIVDLDGTLIKSDLLIEFDFRAGRRRACVALRYVGRLASRQGESQRGRGAER